VEAQSSQLVSTCSVQTAPVRVLFDGRKLGDGGIGVYIDNTIRGLLAHGGIELGVIATPEQAQRVGWRNEVRWFYDRARSYSLAEYLLLARRVDHSSYDLFHAPHFTLPFGLRIPAVVTVHDLIHIEHPEKSYYPFIARRLIRSAVQRAAAVVAVSESTKKSLETHIAAARSRRIEVIPNAIPVFVREESRVDNHNVLSVNIPSGQRYFVAVISNAKPHKGVAELIEGYAMLRAKLNASATSECPALVLVGYGAAELARDSARYSDLSRVEGVRILGALKPPQLRQVYASALALVVASRAEGFCLPALEAQSVGTRVVCTPVPALKELVSSQDLVARDFSSGALMQVLLEAASAPVSARRVDTQHLERFSLESTAQQLVHLYSSIAGRRAPYCQEAA
jgi:glycosyltransferase involved in cell wall biosynthesis